MPVHRIELAIEYDGPMDDAFVALAAAMGGLGLDPHVDVVEIQEGTDQESGNQVLVALIQPQEGEGDEYESADI
jgi:hypothetical protein